MKKILISILLLSFLFPSDYYFSNYGSGEKIFNLNPSSVSLGWSNLFSSQIANNISSLSQFYKSDMVRVNISSDFNFYYINENKYFSQKINFFSFLLPLQDNKKGLGFSLSPYYRINSSIIENDYNYFPGLDENNGPLAYKSEYNFTGGPSVASLLYSSKLSDNFSLGLSFNYIFGSLYSNVKHNIYDIYYNDISELSYVLQSSDIYTSIKKYNGLGIDLELSYLFKKNRLVSSISLLNDIKVNEFFYDDVIIENLEFGVNFNEETAYSLSAPLEFNFGYSRSSNKSNGIVFEFYIYESFNSNNNILNENDLDKNKINIGYYKSYQNNKFTLSGGLYNFNSSNNYMTSNKYGTTFGLDFNVIRNISINTCLEIGRNKINTSQLLTEDYINLYLGISTADKWFK
jgi:hypothetical protein